ncbi:hypothetical protein pb186bvf_003302 [Paramecium bursaria]
MRQMGRIIDLGGRKISDLGVQEFYKLIHQVFIDGLICVKNQHLDLDKDFLSVICKLGNTKHITNILRREQDEPNFPQLFRIGNLRVDGTVKKGHKFAEYWHQDGDFWGYPDNFIVQWLLSKYTPKIGGETAFIDGIAALELIETELRDKLLEAEFEFRVNDIEDFKEFKTQDKVFQKRKIKHKTVYKHKILNKNYLYIGYESNVINLKMVQLWVLLNQWIFYYLIHKSLYSQI